MNKKLRLLVTTDCPNKCPMCCNNQFDFSKLPVVDRWDYDEIMITGGEPLLFVTDLAMELLALQSVFDMMGTNPKIYVYTADCTRNVAKILYYVDGVVLTPHKALDVEHFIELNTYLLKHKDDKEVKSTSLRLNLFPDMKALLPKDIDLSLWQVKDIEWIENCPVPEGEDFRRIANLW